MLALEEQHVAADRFQDRQQAVQELVAALQVQQHLQGQSFVATQKRKAAMSELDRWMAKFIKRARVAFDNNEEQLHKLGIGVKVRS